MDKKYHYQFYFITVKYSQGLKPCHQKEQKQKIHDPNLNSLKLLSP